MLVVHHHFHLLDLLQAQCCYLVHGQVYTGPVHLGQQVTYRSISIFQLCLRTYETLREQNARAGKGLLFLAAEGLRRPLSPRSLCDKRNMPQYEKLVTKMKVLKYFLIQVVAAEACNSMVSPY